MSPQGTELEPDVKPEAVAGAEPRATEDDAALEQELAGDIVDDGKGKKLVPLSSLMGAKRDVKRLNAKVKELEPVAGRVKDVEERLAKAEPVIGAILANPKLKAEALRIAAGEGTRTTALGTEQPVDDDDAQAHAEDYGMYLADGITPDVARARRALNRIGNMTGRQTDEKMRPLAGLTLGQKAEENFRQALAAVDDEGVPLATEESLRETFKMLPPHLLASPEVVDLAVNNAIGLDRRKKRTPKAPDEPLRLEAAGGRGRRPEAISQDEKKLLTRVGLTEKEYTDTSKRIENTTPGRGVRLE